MLAISGPQRSREFPGIFLIALQFREFNDGGVRKRTIEVQTYTVLSYIIIIRTVYLTMMIVTQVAAVLVLDHKPCEANNLVFGFGIIKKNLSPKTNKF